MIKSRSVKKMLLFLFVAFCCGASAGTPALSDGSALSGAMVTKTDKLAMDKPIGAHLSDRKEVPEKRQRVINVVIGTVMAVVFVGGIAAFAVSQN